MSFGRSYIAECDHKVVKWQAIVDKTNDLMEQDAIVEASKQK